MHIIKQQYILVMLFVVAMLIMATLGVLAWRNSNSLAKARNWSLHSDDVMTSIRDAKQAFSDADLCGRRALAGLNSCGTLEKREKTLSAIARVRQLTSDSAAQEQNVGNTLDAINERFKIQDEAARLVTRDNGSVIIPIEQNLSLTEALSKVERSFSTLESQEHSVLRLRHQELYSKELTHNRLTFFLLGFGALTSTAFAYFSRRVLWRGQRVTNFLNHEIYGRNVVPINKEKIESLIGILKGEI